MSLLKSAFFAVPVAAVVGLGIHAAEEGRQSPFFKMSLPYQAAVFALFFVMYLTIPGGFRENFNTPNDKTGDSWNDILYFTTITHTSVGFGDMYPLTPRARALATIHSMLAFAGAANVIAWAS